VRSWSGLLGATGGFPPSSQACEGAAQGVDEARVAEILAPSIAFVGDLDPDFPDPAAELD